MWNRAAMYCKHKEGESTMFSGPNVMEAPLSCNSGLLCTKCPWKRFCSKREAIRAHGTRNAERSAWRRHHGYKVTRPTCQCMFVGPQSKDSNIQSPRLRSWVSWSRSLNNIVKSDMHWIDAKKKYYTSFNPPSMVIIVCEPASINDADTRTQNCCLLGFTRRFPCDNKGHGGRHSTSRLLVEAKPYFALEYNDFWSHGYATTSSAVPSSPLSGFGLTCERKAPRDRPKPRE